MSAQKPGDDELSFASGDFVGRQAELRRIDAMLAAPGTRLITLLGPGGIGKTTLAAEVVRRQRLLPNRPVYVSRLGRLAPFTGASAVAAEVMRTVGVADPAPEFTWSELVAAFHGGNATGVDRPLLMLDNCEHVLSGVGALIVGLLEAAPELTVLATTREPVGWVDEQLVIVPPLTDDQAVELFRRRAERTGRPIPDDPEQSVVVERICGHVDRNPLFIRLAAARLLHRTPTMVLRELSGDIDDRRMAWPPNAKRGMEYRHRSVRDVVAWSYGLCTEPERLLLERMSIFATGSDSDRAGALDAGTEAADIAAVCADAALSEQRVGELLERLTERSLVSVHLAPRTTHYYLLESVGVFARQRLAQRRDGLDEAALLARLRRHFLARVSAGPDSWYGPRESEWVRWAQRGWDNILLAIETSLVDPNEAVLGLEIATVLMQMRVQFPARSNHVLAALARRALASTALADPVPTELRCTARAVISWVALWQGHGEESAQLLAECVTECLTDPAARAGWRSRTGVDLQLPAVVEFTWGVELFLAHDARSIEVLARARGKYRRASDRAGEMRSEMFEVLAIACFCARERSLDTTAEYLARTSAADAGSATAWAEVARLIALARHGDPHEAVAIGKGALRRHLGVDISWTAAALVHFTTTALAHVLADRLADPPDSTASLVAAATEIAHLHGGIRTLYRSMGIVVDSIEVVTDGADFARDLAISVLGEKAYEEAVARAALWRPERDEAQRYILGEVSPAALEAVPAPAATARASAPGPVQVESTSAIGQGATRQHPGDHNGPSERWSALTPAERDVAVLAAAGLPNSAIAVRRGSSIRTVDAQIASVLRKLECVGRSAIARQIPSALRAEHAQAADHDTGRSER